jgi:N-acetyl-anhydromuramyl-L-alanine amidase AmpD
VKPIGAFIARGVDVPIDAAVHRWTEHGMHFTCGTRRETRMVVNHWTAAENSPPRVFESLRDRRNARGLPEPLSVHFACDALGELWQFADTEARCSHAKAHGANNWSIGIEFICRGDNFAAPSKGIVRDRVTDLIHGKLTTYDTLTPAQVATGIRLNEALCRVYGLPFVVPVKAGEVYATELPAAYVARFRGCTAHYQLEAKKRDPGLRFMRALRDYADVMSPPPAPPRIA